MVANTNMWKKQGHMTLEDFALNKKGTVGVEPIGQFKNGQMRYYSEVKLGKLGKIDIPRKAPK